MHLANMLNSDVIIVETLIIKGYQIKQVKIQWDVNTVTHIQQASENNSYTYGY